MYLLLLYLYTIYYIQIVVPLHTKLVSILGDKKNYKKKIYTLPLRIQYYNHAYRPLCDDAFE